jgi:hypothetical protein
VSLLLWTSTILAAAVLISVSLKTNWWREIDAGVIVYQISRN